MKKSLYVKRLSQKFLILAIFLSISFLFARPADLNPYSVTARMNEIMYEHAVYKKLSPQIAKRALANFIALLDPQKSYFLESEVEPFLSPTDSMLQKITKDFEYSRFAVFEAIFDKMQEAVVRRELFDQQIMKGTLPEDVKGEEFKRTKWCRTPDELYTYLLRFRAYQLQLKQKLDNDLVDEMIQEMKKTFITLSESQIPQNAQEKNKLFCTVLLKAFASSLDAHTHYYTPDEAKQFLVSMEQSLVGIGAKVLVEGDKAVIVKIIEHSPCDISSDIFLGDKIVAIDNKTIAGLDAMEIADKMRGPQGSDVTLTILRDTTYGKEKVTEKKDVVITRQDVVLKESRTEIVQEPFGSGIIAVVKLHSFYQDQTSSSAKDIAKSLSELVKEKKVKGVILDLRCNTGGLLSEAIDIVGLFIDKGVVCSTKDASGKVQHFRNIESDKIYDGPLVVLIDRLSASAAEIVAQSLQDYKRAIVVGDDHSYGKGSFQTFTLPASVSSEVDPEGEYKVTRGRYYTVSGKTPQLVGVQSNIVIPGELSYLEIGEEYAKFPLENDEIEPSYNDTLDDVAFFEKGKIRRLYEKAKQKPSDEYVVSVDQLKNNSSQRLSANKQFTKFLDGIKKIEEKKADDLAVYQDFQVQEAVNIVKDIICMQSEL